MAYERASRFVVPAHGGAITTGISVARKSSNSVSQNKRGGDAMSAIALTLGSPRPVRNCAPGGDDVERLHPHGDGSSVPCQLVNATVTSLVYALPTISLAS